MAVFVQEQAAPYEVLIPLRRPIYIHTYIQKTIEDDRKKPFSLSGGKDFKNVSARVPRSFCSTSKIQVTVHTLFFLPTTNVCFNLECILKCQISNIAHTLDKMQYHIGEIFCLDNKWLNIWLLLVWGKVCLRSKV